MDDPNEKAIRDHYADLGVEEFYLQHGDDYINPHVTQIQHLLTRNQHRIDYSTALDFCCGGGEVTSLLHQLGFTQTIGCDPFTEAAFEKNTGKQALNLSFMDVVQGKLSGRFSTVICSFAMHLCRADQLFMLCFQLFEVTPTIVIITPHKRPALETLDGVALKFEDSVLTQRGKKVRLKCYQKQDREL